MRPGSILSVYHPHVAVCIIIVVIIVIAMTLIVVVVLLNQAPHKTMLAKLFHTIRMRGQCSKYGAHNCVVCPPCFHKDSRILPT